MRLIIFGPPGAGKGTQAKFIAKHFSIPHISTGEIFRAAIQKGTPMGIEAKKHLDTGNLVPDDVTNSIVREALADEKFKDGFLLDGFPRTLPQAEALDKMLQDMTIKIDHVINLVVEENEIIRRMLGRGRADDIQETIDNRIKVYMKDTEPLIRYYQEKGILIDIHGMGEISEISQRIIEKIKGEN